MFVRATAVADYDRLRVVPLTGTIGAEVGGVDLREVDDAVLGELRHAWLAHKVLFFRDQPFSHGEHVAYGRLFGELEVHPFLPAPDGHPEIVILESTPQQQVAADQWHSDVTWREEPSLGSILYGRQIPPYGGDTAWADMEAAYDLLEDTVKERVEGRTATHSFVKTFGRGKSPDELAALLERYPETSHPIVRTHPETGRRSLYVNRTFTVRVDGLDEAESSALLERLYRQADLPQVQCRFRWQPQSIAQWDNRCTQHYAIPDYGGFSRRVERVTIMGDRPS